MSNETKRDVFDSMKQQFAEHLENTMGQNGALHPWKDASKVIDKYTTRYADALSDDLPILSEDVSNTIKKYRHVFWLDLLNKAYNNELSEHGDDINYKIRSESDNVALACITGVWKVNETGEVVKL